MKRNDAEPIGKLIQQFLRQESLESPLNERQNPLPQRKMILVITVAPTFWFKARTNFSRPIINS